MKLRTVFCCFIFGFLLCGCVSNKNIVQKSDFCGIVVDENNRPVPNFLVKCTHSSLYSETALTNGSGIFLFPQLNSGNYVISGSKDNFTFLEEEQFYFRDNSSLFCCQVRSLKDVIQTVDSYIENKEYKKGVILLEKVKIRENELNKALILSYKAYLYFKVGQMDIYDECINELKQIENDKCNNFIKKMEMNNYENN